MKLKAAAYGLIILIWAAGSSLGQNTGLTGSVQDQTGATVAGAEVTLRERRSGARLTTVTDAEGKFTFKASPGSDAELIVRSRGFREVVVAVGSDLSAPVVLEPEAIKEQVTITATRTQIATDDTAVPVTVIDRESIERQGVNTIGDIFRILPGTATNNEGSFQVRPRVRGLESNRVLVLVDGERLNNSRTATGQSGIETGLVETSQVETVEIARGSGSVLYGTDALAGTINIITRDTPARIEKGFRLGAILDTFYASNSNGRRGSLAVTGSSNFFAFRLAQSLERFENYFTGKADGNVPADVLALGGIAADGEVLNSQSHGSNSQATLRFFLNDTSTIRANYERRRGADIGSPTLVGLFNAYFPFSNRDKVSGRYNVVNLSDHLRSLSASVFYQTQYRDFTSVVTVPPVPPFFPGQYQFSDTVTDTKTSGFDVQTDWALGSRNQLIAGTSFFRDANTDRRLLISASTPTSLNRTVRNSRSVPDASLTNIAFFAQNTFRVNSRLRIIGGIRYDRFTTKAEPTAEFTLDPRFTQSQIEDLGIAGIMTGLNVRNSAITGDIGAVFKITNQINASARVGRSFRTPNIFERYFTDPGSVDGFLVGNPNLVPETGINFDSSVKLRTFRFAGAVTYFNNFYEDFLATPAALDRNGNPILLPRPGRSPLAVYQTQNVRKARIQGIEVEAEYSIKISLGYLTPYGNFSYLRGDNLTENVPLDSISPFRTNAGFRWQNYLKSYYFDYNARLVGKQDRLTPRALLPVNQGGNGGPEPGFITHNLGGGYYFARERFNFNINLAVNNIFDRSYSEQFVYAPARGRSFTIGTKWEIK